MELEHKLGRPVFLDSDDLRQMKQLESAVCDSDVLVVIQTQNVSHNATTRPELSHRSLTTGSIRLLWQTDGYTSALLRCSLGHMCCLK